MANERHFHPLWTMALDEHELLNFFTDPGEQLERNVQVKPEKQYMISFSYTLRENSSKPVLLQGTPTKQVATAFVKAPNDGRLDEVAARYLGHRHGTTSNVTEASFKKLDSRVYITLREDERKAYIHVPGVHLEEPMQIQQAPDGPTDPELALLFAVDPLRFFKRLVAYQFSQQDGKVFWRKARYPYDSNPDPNEWTVGKASQFQIDVKAEERLRDATFVWEGPMLPPCYPCAQGAGTYQEVDGNPDRFAIFISETMLVPYCDAMHDPSSAVVDASRVEPKDPVHH